MRIEGLSKFEFYALAAGFFLLMLEALSTHRNRPQHGRKD